MAKRGAQFQTIRTEGAILPPDILRRIASLKVEGATPDAYHLPPGSKLNEAISQSWTVLLNHWRAFQDARAKLGENGETGTAVTNERWLLPLFNELDYGRLVTTKSPVIDERSYPIERFYNHTPIHLIGCKLPLDRRTKGARGAATASPHSMVQEFLNQSEEHVWAFLSNGLQLRILRDNVSLSRQTFVEFDLEAMMDGEVYADFALLWLLCHQSRVESEKPEECWLEKWSKLAREQGTRVLNDLRVGVGNAIEALGRGFIGHPRNDQLRAKLQSGTLSKDEFYRQLLRIVYRLLFLFVAEDRELLHAPDASKDACHLYDEHYSTRRLRELALKMRGSKHADLWHSLSLVFDALGKNKGCPQLGLTGLGSFLWRASSTADLLGPHQANGEAVLITNDDLLQGVRALAYVEQDRALRMVDYRNLGSEELGSVYESLLELHPVMDVEGKSFDLMTAAGNERKTTGSYYTPDCLVQCLLDSALDPVVEDRLKDKKGDEAEKALLEIKVCDPASGSGHFLIAAAHRLARHLARARTGDAEPSPEDYQHALRDIIGRCLYGVDINPMAVELCKVSLWMEAIEPGKPLSFLDHHIQCGNSLLGTTPALMSTGIPDEAFKAIEGDDKHASSELKKANKRERGEYASGQGYLFSPPIKLGNLPATLAKLNNSDEESLTDIAAKEAMYAELVKGADYRNARLLADTWCAAFVWKKDNSDLGRLCPTERCFRSIEDNPHSINIHVRGEVERLARQYHFFHWHLAFPDIFGISSSDEAGRSETAGWTGGFDTVLGNPPWERVKIQEKEWFSERRPDIANAANAAARKRMIEALRNEDATLFNEFKEALRTADAESGFFRRSGGFPYSGTGDVNTYAIFTEVATRIVGPNGMVGIIIPTGLATDDQLKDFFTMLVDDGRLASLVGFENEEFLFEGIANVVRFCAITISGTQREIQNPQFAFYIRNAEQISDESRYFSLTRQDLDRLNPNTRTCPIFRTRFDAELTLQLYQRFPILRHEGTGSNPWGITYCRMFDMATDSDLFLSQASHTAVPLYEAKLFWHYDHRFGSYEFKGILKGKGGRGLPDMPLIKHQDPTYAIRPQYWVERSHVESKVRESWTKEWLLAFRKTSSAKLERTLVGSALPLAAVNDKAPIIFLGGEQVERPHLFLSCFNSIALDYIARQKVGGTDVGYYHVDQLPFPTPADFSSEDDKFIRPRVLELMFTAQDIEAFSRDLGWTGEPFKWDDDRRFTIQCELDAYFAHFFGINREQWLFMLDPEEIHGASYPGESFRVLKEKEEEKFGEFRTKRALTEIYDEMAEAICAGQSYQTRLDPSPGPPTDAEGNFIPLAEWDPNNWPSHIHPPRKESEVAT